MFLKERLTEMKRKIREEAELDIIKALAKRAGEGYHYSELKPIRDLLVDTLNSFNGKNNRSVKEPLTGYGSVGNV